MSFRKELRLAERRAQSPYGLRGPIGGGMFGGGDDGKQTRSVSLRNAPASIAGGALPYMIQMFDSAPYDFDTFGLDFGAWYGYQETPLAGNLTVIGAAFWYPGLGSHTPLTFNGNLSKTVAGGLDIEGDMVKLNRTIHAGEKYYYRFQWQGDTAIPYTGAGLGNNIYVPGGDALEQTATNKCYSGTVNDQNIGIAMWPTVVKARTRLQVPGIIGDSREAGAGEVPDATGILGSVTQAISSFTTGLKVAISGDNLADFVAHHTHRLAMLLKYTDFTINALAFNDLAAGALPATCAAQQQQIAAFLAGRRYYVTTIAPQTTSTDQFATQGNQAVLPNHTNILAYNALVLAGLGGLVTGPLDIRAAFEFGLTSGKWLTNGTPFAFTPDGTHPSRLADSGVIITPAQIGL